MLKIERFRSFLPVFLVPILLILIMWSITKSPLFYAHQKELSAAILLDLLLMMPFLHFLMIRKKKIPKLTIVSVFVVGIFTAGFILPKSNQSLLIIIKTYFFPLLELGVFSFLIYKASQVLRKFKSDENSNLDFFDAIQIAVKSIVPNKISGFLATEIAVVYYAFFSWKKPSLKENEFSNYKENGIKILLFAFILIICIETFALHVFVEKYSFIIAWLLSFLSVYTMLQIFALIKSLSKRPIYIDKSNQQIVLRFGFFGLAQIPFSNIDFIALHDKDLPENKSVIPFSPLGTLGGHNVIFNLKTELQFEGFYGSHKNANKIAVFVDDKNRFIKLFENLK